MIEYVDISDNNGTPNLRAYYNAGHRYLMLKATEGTGYAWPQMQRLADQWHGFGGECHVGYYHWLYGTYSGAAQYAWFWLHVRPVFLPGDWMMTDFEDVDPARWVSDAVHLAVVREFDALAGQHGAVHDYAPNWYIAQMPLCRAYFKTRLIVESDYSHDPPANPYGMRLAAHQHTDRATVAGFAGPVDLNRWLINPATAITGTTSEDELSSTEFTQIMAAFGKLNDRIDDLAADVKSGDNATRVWAKPFLTGLSDDSDAVVKALTDSKAGVLAQVAALGQKVTTIQTALHGTTTTTSTSPPVNLSPIEAELKTITTALSNLSVHLGGAK